MVSMCLPLLAMSKLSIVAIIAVVVVVASMIALSIYGKKLQKQQEESREQLEAAKQSMKILVIDKKRMKIKDAGLPAMVLDKMPKRYRNQKLPIVKAKIGPQIMSLICEEKIFDLIPVKKEVRASISGIYILEVKGIRDSLEAKGKKLSMREKIQKKASDLTNDLTKSKDSSKSDSKADSKSKKKK